MASGWRCIDSFMRVIGAPLPPLTWRTCIPLNLAAALSVVPLPLLADTVKLGCVLPVAPSSSVEVPQLNEPVDPPPP